MNLDIINPAGIKIGEHKGTFPLTHLYPDEPVVIIDWGIRGRPDADAIATPIPYAGRQFYGAFYWGSMVKKGKTIGVTSDFLRHLVQRTADGQRVGRYLLHDGFYGQTFRRLKIKVVAPNTWAYGHLIDDGCHLVNRALAETVYTKEQKVKLGRTKESFSWWQRVPLSQALIDELTPFMQEKVERAHDPFMVLGDAPASFAEKKELVSLEERMIYHPYIAEALNRASAEYLARAVTTVDLKPHYLVAVPTDLPFFVWPGHHGRLSLSRFPIDSNSSIAACEIDNTPAYQKESARIRAIELVQDTVAAHDLFIKGCGILADTGEYDLVICAEDIKLAPDLDEMRARDEIEVEGVLSLGMWWKAGSCMGVNLKWGKTAQKWDCDGDAGHLKDLNRLPVLYATLRALPEAESVKLIKRSTRIDECDERAEMIYKSMQNLVGAASNVAAATFMVADREALAQNVGFTSAASLDKALNFYITAGTDGFKTTVDLDSVMKQVMQLQTQIIKVYGQTAQWTGWPDPREYNPENEGTYRIFRNAMPLLEEDIDPETCSADEWFHCLKFWQDGTVATLAKIMLPGLADLLEHKIAHEPLTVFRQWAWEPSGEALEAAKGVQEQFNRVWASIDWSDGEGIQKARARFNREVEVWMAREGLTRQEAACHLWHVSHSARSVAAQGASVFWAFPEETKWIVAEKPGLVKVKAGSKPIILNGLDYQLPGVSTLTVPVEVVDLVEVKSGKNVVRKIVTSTHPHQAPKGEYPQAMIALVAVNSDQPDPGKYVARIERFGDRSHKAYLVPA